MNNGHNISMRPILRHRQAAWETKPIHGANDDDRTITLNRPELIYIAYITVLLLLLGPMVRDLTHIWLTGSAYHHCLFAGPIAIALYWRNRDKAESISTTKTSMFIASLLSLGLLCLMAVGQNLGINFIQHSAFAGLLISGFLFLFGFAQVRLHGAALLMIFFMIPVGDVFLPPLQTITASSITELFQLTGMSISRDGNLLTTNAGRFNVAESCAGMRFMMSAAMIAFLFGALNLTNKKMIAVFVGAALVLAVLVNMVRAYLMVLIATLSDMRYATGIDHLYFGWLIYFASFAMIILLGRALVERSKAH